MIRMRRVYDPPSSGEGALLLIDRLWPRGVKKVHLAGVTWLKEAAPSDDLRRWFGHDPKKWPEFQRRYRAELDAHPDAWQPIADAARRGPVTLLFGAKDAEHSNAAVLRAYLESILRSGPPGSRDASRGGTARTHQEARHG